MSNDKEGINEGKITNEDEANEQKKDENISIDELLSGDSYDSLLKTVEILRNNDDPEDAPFQSKYKAISLLNDLLDKAENIVSKGNGEGSSLTKKEIQDKLASVHSLLGTLHIDTEDTTSGEVHLMKALKHYEERLDSLAMIVDQGEFEPQLSISTMAVCNQLGILWNSRTDREKSEIYLRQAEKIYFDFKRAKRGEKLSHSETESTIPTRLNPDLKDLDEQTLKIESMYTHVLFYMAQLFRFQKKPHLSGIYIQQTLERQLIFKQFEPVDWTQNAAQLSTYYMSQRAWKQACQCLIAADKMFARIPSTKLADDPTTKANVAIGWGKFYLTKLQEAKCNFVGEPQPAKDDTFGVEFSDNLFEELEMVSGDEPELLLAEKPINTYDEAKVIFNKALQWFNKAKDIYVLDGYVTEHFDILQDIGQLYLTLIPFEPSTSIKCKLHKRRINLVEGLVDLLNPTYYLSTLRQITFQLGETYNQMVDLKLDSGSKVNAKSAIKINKLIAKGIKYFKMFHKHFEEKGQLKVGEENMEAFLLAHLCIARLHSRIVDFNLEIQIGHLRESLKEYEWIIAFTKEHHPTVLNKELSICEEMIQLLPAKINNLHRELLHR